jgi:exonuclease SbcD
MRLLHTADLHLGRSLHGADLIEDQAHLLDQFIDLARQEKPDAVVIAGDVYDRAVPPVKAIELLNEALTRLVADLAVPVIMIAGNHDGPARLAFGNRLLAERGLHILGGYGPDRCGVTVEDAHGGGVVSGLAVGTRGHAVGRNSPALAVLP